MYGSTEAGGLIALSQLDDPLELRLGSAGRPFHGIELKILDPETGAELPAGRAGPGSPSAAGRCSRATTRTTAPLDADGYLLSSDRRLAGRGSRAALFLG